jgi:hypothetical protein
MFTAPATLSSQLTINRSEGACCRGIGASLKSYISVFSKHDPPNRMTQWQRSRLVFAKYSVRHMRYPDWRFSWISSSPPSKCPDSTKPLASKSSLIYPPIIRRWSDVKCPTKIHVSSYSCTAPYVFQCHWRKDNEALNEIKYFTVCQQVTFGPDVAWEPLYASLSKTLIYVNG